MKLIDLLNEIRPKQSRVVAPLPEDLIPYFEEVTEYFGEMDSGFYINEPITEIWGLRDEDERDEDDALVLLFKGLIKANKSLYSSDGNSELVGPSDAPEDAFYYLIMFDATKNKMTVKSPYVNGEGTYAGWFNSGGEYVPTTTMDEDGDYL